MDDSVIQAVRDLKVIYGPRFTVDQYTLTRSVMAVQSWPS